MKITRLSRHETVSVLPLPYFMTYAQAGTTGFPSPADDYMKKTLDLNEHLVKNPASTFYCRVTGDSMKDLGILDGDLLVVDRSVEPAHGHVVLVVLDGELTCKLLDKHRRRLLSANDKYPPIPINADVTFEIEGVVTSSVTYHYVCIS